MHESPPANIFADLVAQQMGNQIIRIDPLRPHGSGRHLYRLYLQNNSTAVGVYNEDVPENLAFTNFATGFRQAGLRVPQILANNGSTAYIETDLGQQTLLEALFAARTSTEFPPAMHRWYTKAVEDLLDFQLKGMAAIDRRLCYQGDKFNAALIVKDVNHFLNEYLARVGLFTSGEDFSADIAQLSRLAENYAPGYFMFRDFQGRNIMLAENELWYIDFQSGREGPLQYDLASLLFQAQANLPSSLRESLLEHYIEKLSARTNLKLTNFRDDFFSFVLLRVMQTLGAYGKLGLGQGKEYFRDSIPYALNNCRYLLAHWPKNLQCPKLRAKIESAVQQ